MRINQTRKKSLQLSLTQDAQRTQVYTPFMSASKYRQIINNSIM